jgi:hypothetical protein
VLLLSARRRAGGRVLRRAGSDFCRVPCTPDYVVSRRALPSIKKLRAIDDALAC